MVLITAPVKGSERPAERARRRVGGDDAEVALRRYLEGVGVHDVESVRRIGGHNGRVEFLYRRFAAWELQVLDGRRLVAHAALSHRIEGWAEVAWRGPEGWRVVRSGPVMPADLLNPADISEAWAVVPPAQLNGEKHYRVRLRQGG